jgi:hypothetical protein
MQRIEQRLCTSTGELAFTLARAIQQLPSQETLGCRQQAGLPGCNSCRDSHSNQCLAVVNTCCYLQDCRTLVMLLQDCKCYSAAAASPAIDDGANTSACHAVGHLGTEGVVTALHQADLTCCTCSTQELPSRGNQWLKPCQPSNC